MNSLVIYPEELSVDGTFRISGSRAKYALFWHDLTEGITIRAGVLGGWRGRLEVLSIKEDVIAGRFWAKAEPIVRSSLEAWVAVPRPQSVKKCIHLAVALGFKTLRFVKTDKVVPSYLCSKSLQPENIQEETLKALEQCVDTIAPKITVHKSLDNLLSDSALTKRQKLEDLTLYLADTNNDKKRHFDLAKGVSTIVAIGPEAGWSENERVVFKNLRFCEVSLGERILRVDHALAVLGSRTT